MLSISYPFLNFFFYFDVLSIRLFCANSFILVTLYGGVMAILPAYIADIFGPKYVSAYLGRLLTGYYSFILLSLFDPLVFCSSPWKQLLILSLILIYFSLECSSIDRNSDSDLFKRQIIYCCCPGISCPLWPWCFFQYFWYLLHISFHFAIECGLCERFEFFFMLQHSFILFC